MIRFKEMSNLRHLNTNQTATQGKKPSLSLCGGCQISGQTSGEAHEDVIDAVIQICFVGAMG